MAKNRLVKWKKTIPSNRKDWSLPLNDTVWAYGASFKTLLGIFSYLLVYMENIVS